MSTKEVGQRDLVRVQVCIKRFSKRNVIIEMFVKY